MSQVPKFPDSSFVTQSDTSFASDPSTSFGSNYTTSFTTCDVQPLASPFNPVILSTTGSNAPHLSSFSTDRRLNGIQGPAPLETQNLAGSTAHLTSWQRQEFYAFPPQPQTASDHAWWGTPTSFSSQDTLDNISPQRNLKRGVEYLHTHTPRAKKRRAHHVCTNCRKNKAACDETRPKCSRCSHSELDCVYEEHKPNKREDAVHLNGIIQKDVEHTNRVLEDIFNNMKSKEIVLNNEVKMLRHEQRTLVAKLQQCMSNNSLQFNHGCRSRMPLQEMFIVNDDLQAPKTTPKPDIHCDPPFEANSTEESIWSNSIPHEYPLPAERNQPLPTHQTLATSLAQTWKVVCSVPKPRGPKFGMKEEVLGDSLAQLAKIAVDNENISGSAKHSPRSPFPTETSEAFLQTSCSNISSPSGPFDREIAQELWITYQTQIHTSFAFLDIPRVEKIIDRITDSPDKTKLSNSSIRERRLQAGPKRRDQNESTDISDLEHETNNCIDAATVLLVFALGNLCQHESVQSPKSSEDIHKLFCSPRNFSTGSKESHLPLSPSVSVSALRRAGLPVHDYLHRQYLSFGAGQSPGAQDSAEHEIPGLHYYCSAVGLLGELCDVADISFAHAKMLAAIYLIQLARSREALDQLQDAKITLKSIQEQEQMPIVSLDDDRWITTYKICLSLESEIIAQPEIFAASPTNILHPGATVSLHPNSEESMDLFSNIQPDITVLLKHIADPHDVDLDSDAPLMVSSESTNKRYGFQGNAYKELPESHDLKSQISLLDQLLYEGEKSRNSDPSATATYRAVRRAALHDNIDRRCLHYLLRNYDSIAFDEDVINIAKCCTDELMRSAETFNTVSAMPAPKFVEDILVPAQGQFANIILIAEILQLKDFRHAIDRNQFITTTLDKTIKTFTRLTPSSSVIEKELFVLHALQRRLIHEPTYLKDLDMKRKLFNEANISNLVLSSTFFENNGNPLEERCCS